ncbi:DUF368 domain-containing protein [Gammaproteobacteria bacterium]|nr:DUF368 domain-containing protein [Gammaproteobacteria bacterium]
MSERLRFIISGFFVGLAELLPGISGSTVAVAFNVYDKFILFLANLKLSNLSFNIKKLNEVFFLDLIIPFFLSMVLSVILASNLILYLLSSYTEYFLYFIGVLMCLVSVLIAFRIKEEFGKHIRLNIQFLFGILFGLLLSQFSSTPLDPSPLFIFFMGFIAKKSKIVADKQKSSNPNSSNEEANLLDISEPKRAPSDPPAMITP